MPSRNGTWEHKWAVLVPYEEPWIYDTEEEAWQAYRRELEDGSDSPRFAEVYIFVPKAAKKEAADA